MEYTGLTKRSPSAIFCRPDGPSLTWCIAVPGCGALCIRTSSNLRDKRGKIVLEGASVFTLAEVGHSPELML